VKWLDLKLAEEKHMEVGKVEEEKSAFWFPYKVVVNYLGEEYQAWVKIEDGYVYAVMRNR
jgi:hypothetical protein